MRSRRSIPVSSASASTSPTSSEPVAGPGKVVAQTAKGWRRVAAVLAGWIVRLWGASLRVHFPEETRRIVSEDERPTLFVLWHNRLFAAVRLSHLLRPNHPLHCLVSASKDGAWLSAFFESAGLKVVRGSSSRGGREAVSELVDVLHAGHDAGITPDGPRGPIYVCKPGAIVVARRAKVRVVVLGICYENAWRMKSWDRFGLPRPFSAVHLCVEEIDPAALAADDAREHLEARLRALNPEFSSAGLSSHGGRRSQVI